MQVNKKDISKFISEIMDCAIAECSWHVEGALAPDLMVKYLKELYTSPSEYLRDYSDVDIEKFVQLMLFPGLSDCHRYLSLPLVDLSIRVETVLSIEYFFEKIYKNRCAKVITFENKKNLNPLNNSCFMWWDISPLIGSNDDKIIEACLIVMEKCLYMNNLACQESALHGLGHLHAYEKWRGNCQKIIERFLNSDFENSLLLKNYAMSAYDGYVQ